MLIDYSTGPRIATEGAHTVYARATWSDAWIEQPNLSCLECQWNAAPAMNTAVLRWELGNVILPGDTAPTVFGAWIGRGQFIRVDWVCDNGSILRWVGFVDSSEWPADYLGSQILVCFGLEQALAKTPITFAMWRDFDDPTVTVRRSEQPLTFNGVGGLMSESAIASTGGTHVFARPNEDAAKKWSTREIVRYLLYYHLPTNTWGVSTIPWAVDQINQLPDWDAPQIETDLRTVWDVLNALINPQQQTGFTVGSDGSAVYLRCFTHLATDLTVNFRTIPANPNQHSLVFAPDALTSAQLSDMGGGYDQVTVRGAKAVTITTLEYADHLEPAWKDTLQTPYDAGASVAGYDIGDSDKQKRSKDAAARGASKFSDVYRVFRIKRNDALSLGAPPDATTRHGVLRLLPRIPIGSQFDWDTGTLTDLFDAKGDGKPPLVTWEHPLVDTQRISNAGLAQLTDALPDTRLPAVTVVTTVKDDTLRLAVHGGPQYLIADGEFDPLDHDLPTILDYRELKVTAAIEQGSYCAATYPTTAAAADIIRRLIVDVGEEYRLVYLADGTLTDVDESGAEKIRTTGGLLVDDRSELEAIARVLSDSVLMTRKTVSWSSLRKISSVAVGDLITTAAGATIVAPVTAVHIRGGVSINAPAGSTQQSYEVYRGGLDVMSVVRRLGGTATALTAPPINAARRKRDSDRIIKRIRKKLRNI